MSKTMSVELVEALRIAGVEVEASKIELTMDQKVERIQELLDRRAILMQESTDDAKKALKVVRRQLRNLGCYLSQLKKASV